MRTTSELAPPPHLLQTTTPRQREDLNQAQSPPIGVVVWRRGCQFVIPITGPKFRITKSAANTPRIAL
ncbi:hypothetical protein TNCV_3811971 [Trichonephila clavipes]|nr:hypothetical protein TNCV_3811971 [Trichonephila clavipes]